VLLVTFNAMIEAAAVKFKGGLLSVLQPVHCRPLAHLLFNSSTEAVLVMAVLTAWL
jgi:hypothetical protein